MGAEGARARVEARLLAECRQAMVPFWLASWPAKTPEQLRADHRAHKMYEDGNTVLFIGPSQLGYLLAIMATAWNVFTTSTILQKR